MTMLVYLAVSFLASIAGAICGIGGGVVIKPVLDLVGVAGVSTVSFLSGCTVLAMSGYSVGKNIAARDNRVNFAIGTPLAVGGAVGGVVGKQLFTFIKESSGSPATVGKVQSVCLAAITLGTLVYTLYKGRIRTRRVNSKAFCVVIGLALGVMSSFLGIGGGPINLVVLFFFFSMETKTAAQNSLYIILFSQITSLITTLVTGTVPDFDFTALVLMVAGGIGGGMLGHTFDKKMDNRAVDKLFIALMAVIICVSVYNAVKVG